MRDSLGTSYACPIPFPPGQGHCTDRQGLALVLACHVLDPHGQVAHRALATAEIEAVWVYEEQVPEKESRGLSHGKGGMNHEVGALRTEWAVTQASQGSWINKTSLLVLFCFVF